MVAEVLHAGGLLTADGQVVEHASEGEIEELPTFDGDGLDFIERGPSPEVEAATHEEVVPPPPAPVLSDVYGPTGLGYFYRRSNKRSIARIPAVFNVHSVSMKCFIHGTKRCCKKAFRQYQLPSRKWLLDWLGRAEEFPVDASEAQKQDISNRHTAELHAEVQKGTWPGRKYQDLIDEERLENPDVPS